MPNVKIKKDGQEYDIGVIPQSLYDDVEDLKDGKVDKSGDTINGILTIDRHNSTTTPMYGYIELGNNKAQGSAGKSIGAVDFYGSDSYVTTLSAAGSSANRNISLPNASGTLALTSDIVNISKVITSSEISALNIQLKSTSENIIHCLLISNLWSNDLTGCYIGVIQIRKNNESCSILDLISTPNVYVKPVPTYDNSTNTLTLTFDYAASRFLTLYYG